MIFNETKLKGAFFIEPKLIKDERGFFARSFCVNGNSRKVLVPPPDPERFPPKPERSVLRFAMVASRALSHVKRRKQSALADTMILQ